MENMTLKENDGVKEGVDQETVDAVREVGGKYKYGWSTDIEMEYAPKGLTPDIVRLISERTKSPSGCLNGALRLMIVG